MSLGVVTGNGLRTLVREQFGSRAAGDRPHRPGRGGDEAPPRRLGLAFIQSYTVDNPLTVFR